MLAGFKDLGVTVPFSFGSNNKLNSNNTEIIASAYGVPMNVQFMQVDGVVSYGPYNEGYKEFITTMNKWYKNGWLDQDFLGRATAKDVVPLMEDGSLGVGVIHLNSTVNAPVTSVKLGKEEVVAVPVPYPVLNEGDVTNFKDTTSVFNGYGRYISTTAKNPEIIAQWVDYFYTEQGSLESVWGFNGIDGFEDTYEIAADGSKSFTSAVEGIELRTLMTRDITPIWDWENQLTVYSDPRMQECWDVWGVSTDDYRMPAYITLTIDENAEYSKS